MGWRYSSNKCGWLEEKLQKLGSLQIKMHVYYMLSKKSLTRPPYSAIFESIRAFLFVITQSAGNYAGEKTINIDLTVVEVVNRCM